MKNFGRLDIKELDGEHISLNNCDVNYIDNNLIIGDNSFSLNSDGNNTLSINSLNNSDSNILFNSDDNSGENVILFNSYSSKLEDNHLAINSISSNYEHSKFSIGTNKTKIPYTFGYNNEYISQNDKTYIFGNNFSGGSENGNFYILSTNSGTNFSGVDNTLESGLIIDNSSNFLIFGNDCLFVYDNIENTSLEKISNEKFLYSDVDSLIEYKNGYWSHKDNFIQKTLSGYISNELVNIEPNNISISGQNQNKNNSVLIDTNENSNIENLSNSIIINNENKLTTTLTDGVYIGNIGKNEYTINDKNVLLLNSSFRVGVDGLSAGDVSLSYEEMSKLTSVDDYFGDIINRVYAKTTPYETFSSTYIQDTLDKTNYKSEYKVVNVDSDNFNMFNIICVDNHNFYDFENGYIVDIYDKNENLLFKIHKNSTTFTLNSLKKYDIEYSTHGGMGPAREASFYIKNAKNSTFYIKFSNYHLKDYIQFFETGNNNDLVKMEEIPRYSYELVYNINGMIIPKEVYYNEVVCKNFTIKNNVDITDLVIDKIEGIYNLRLEAFKTFNSKNYELNSEDLARIVILTDKFIANELTTSLNQIFIKHNSKNINIESEKPETGLDLFTLESIPISTLNNVEELRTKDLVFENYFKDTDFYKDSNMYLYHWGCMASFWYNNTKCYKKYSSQIQEHVKVLTQNDKNHLNLYDDYYYYPFAGINQDNYNKFKPCGSESLKIKVMIKHGKLLYTIIADYFRHQKWGIKDTDIEFYPLLNIYNKEYYKYNYGYYGSMSLDVPFDTSDTRFMETETLTYMTQVFNR